MQILINHLYYYCDMLKIPIFKIMVDDGVDGVQKISLVHSPAVESNFLAFDEQNPDAKPFKFEMDEEERVIYGCALRADFPIYRRDDERGEYYVVFGKDTIKQLVEKFAKNGNYNNVNLDHKEDTDGVVMTQMFIKDVEKGINPSGFSEIEDGSLFTVYKVFNDDVWNGIKEGEWLGLSAEGVFKLLQVPTQEKMSSEVDEYEAYINNLFN